MSYIKKRYFIKNEIKAYLFLVKNFNISMREAQRWIDRGRVLFENEIIKKKSQILKGEVEIFEKIYTTRGLKPLFQTEDFVIFDKPSGVLIHSKNRYTDYSLTDEVKYQFGREANITHRIDKETTGLILCSKNREAEREIKQLFQERKIKKSYIALVEGKIEKELFIDAPILKNRNFEKIKLKVVIDKKGKPSQTIIKPIRYLPEKNQTLIEAHPLTGRQHQIRIHLFYINHRIVGDPIYGVSYNFANKYLNQTISIEERIEETGANRLMLHSHSLEFFFKNRYRIVSKIDRLKFIV